MALRSFQSRLSPSSRAIEVFDVDGDRLVFRPPRLTHALLDSPNDLVALPDGQIYVTNMGPSRGITGLLSLLLGLRLGTVVHYKDGQWHPVADGISYANGIAVSPAGDTLFVAGLRDQGIHVYPRNPGTGAIGARARFIPVGSGVDNLTWADARTLVVAAHPKLLALALHARDAARRAPSQIYRIDAATGASTLVYADDGATISAASTGLVWKDRLYMGQVFGRGIVACPRP